MGKLNNFTNIELYEEGKKIIKEMQHRGLKPNEVTEKLELFTEEENKILIRALDLLVNKENDTDDYTKLYNKLGEFY